MPPPSDAIAWYDANATSAAARFEAHDPAALNGWLTDLLPKSPAVIMDIGAGSGRDAAWLAAMGHEVLAVEPSAALRTAAARLHPDDNIRWLDDWLPDMAGPIRAGLSADAILLSAVWMHVRPTERPRAFRKLVSLLRPGGLLAVTLRHGPADSDRGMHPVSLPELEHLAADHGLAVVRVQHQGDLQGRSEVSWTCVALRLPDDGTSALPLLRHVILRDTKSSTYKLGLLRSLCRIADGWAGLARETEDGHIALPLGLVGLTWLRLYLPLARADLPQSPTNIRGGENLGFAGDEFRALLAGVLSPLDLRVGASFSGDAAKAVHIALRDACDTISRMPAHFMTYPGSNQPILPTCKARRDAGMDRLRGRAARQPRSARPSLSLADDTANGSWCTWSCDPANCQHSAIIPVCRSGRHWQDLHHERQLGPQLPLPLRPCFEAFGVNRFCYIKHATRRGRREYEIL